MQAVVVTDPSAQSEPQAIAVVAGVLLSWRPERGWMCSAHTTLPCTHTSGLAEPDLVLET